MYNKRIVLKIYFLFIHFVSFRYIPAMALLHHIPHNKPNAVETNIKAQATFNSIGFLVSLVNIIANWLPLYVKTKFDKNIQKYR